MFGALARLIGAGAARGGAGRAAPAIIGRSGTAVGGGARAAGTGAVRESFASRASSGLWALSQVEELLNRNSPTASDMVTVTIVGMPNANVTNLYLAALSIASGVLAWNTTPFAGSPTFSEGFPFNSVHSAQSKISYMSKTVTIVLGYAQQGFVQGYLPGGAAWSAQRMFARPINDPVYFFNYPSFLQAGLNSKGPLIPSSRSAAQGGNIAIGSAPDNTPGLQTGGYNGSGAFGPGSAVEAPLISGGSVPPTSGSAGTYSAPSNQQLLAVVRRLFQPDF